MILLADKGKATIVMDSTDYKQKLKALLDNRTVYRILKKDPTTTYKIKLVKILRVEERGDRF